MLRYTTDTAWCSHLVRHPARKRSGSILTTPEPARGSAMHGVMRVKMKIWMCNSCLYNIFLATILFPASDF